MSAMDAAAGVSEAGLRSFEGIAKMGSMLTLGKAAKALRTMGIKIIDWTIGTSSILICIKVKGEKRWLAFNVEGLGTKGLVADEIYALKAFGGLTAQEIDNIHHESGISAVAMSLNDLIIHGAVPVIYGQHVEYGDPDWPLDVVRSQAIANGTAQACVQSGAAWPLGETAQLEDLLLPGKASLSGASLGMVPPGKKPFDYRRMKPGDRILLLASSGVHANGLTAIRKLVANPDINLRWDTQLSDGRLFGEAVLTPTVLYAPAVAALHAAGVRAIACHNVTGGGFRRPLRYKLPWSYRIEGLPPRPAEFDAIQRAGAYTTQQMYSAANNGVGFMIIVRVKDEDRAYDAIQHAGFTVYYGGTVFKDDSPHVEIPEIDVIYTEA